MKNLSRAFIVLILLFPSIAQTVIINEVAWMGTETSYNDEWIELYNDSSENISLEGWILKADDGTPEINLQGTIPAKGFYLLERTDDETIPDIPADLIYTGALGNNGENLKLYNNENLIDEIICLEGWPGGDNQTKQTMQRIDSQWQDANPTPKNSNIEVLEQSEEVVSEEPEIITKDESAPLIQTYPKNITFTEIVPSPEGPDDENEWIEIYSNNEFEIDLSGWVIKDSLGRTTEYILSARIPAFSYLILKRPETKITLNNDGDKLTLLNPDKEIIDSVEFGKAVQGESYIKTPSGWAWTTALTPEKENITTDVSSIDSSINQKVDLSKTIPLSQSSQKNIFLTALIVAILSGIAFLIIKHNLKAFWY